MRRTRSCSGEVLTTLSSEWHRRPRLRCVRRLALRALERDRADETEATEARTVKHLSCVRSCEEMVITAQPERSDWSVSLRCSGRGSQLGQLHTALQKSSALPPQSCRITRRWLAPGGLAHTICKQQQRSRCVPSVSLSLRRLLRGFAPPGPDPRCQRRYKTPCLRRRPLPVLGCVSL